VKVKLQDWPFDRYGELKVCGPLLVVIVCGAVSSLVHVMVSPTSTVIEDGAYA
jgi:membrane associated rhomboid family serine protease